MVGPTAAEQRHDQRQGPQSHEDKEDARHEGAFVRRLNQLLRHWLNVGVHRKAQNHQANQLQKGNNHSLEAKAVSVHITGKYLSAIEMQQQWSRKNAPLPHWRPGSIMVRRPTPSYSSSPSGLWSSSAPQLYEALQAPEVARDVHEMLAPAIPAGTPHRPIRLHFSRGDAFINEIEGLNLMATMPNLQLKLLPRTRKKSHSTNRATKQAQVVHILAIEALKKTILIFID